MHVLNGHDLRCLINSILFYWRTEVGAHLAVLGLILALCSGAPPGRAQGLFQLCAGGTPGDAQRYLLVFVFWSAPWRALMHSGWCGHLHARQTASPQPLSLTPLERILDPTKSFCMVFHIHYFYWSGPGSLEFGVHCSLVDRPFHLLYFSLFIVMYQKTIFCVHLLWKTRSKYPAGWDFSGFVYGFCCCLFAFTISSKVSSRFQLKLIIKMSIFYLG